VNGRAQRENYRGPLKRTTKRGTTSEFGKRGPTPEDRRKRGGVHVQPGGGGEYQGKRDFKKINIGMGSVFNKK